MPTSTRASMDGPVDERINYESWLHSKTHEEREQVLGKGKADLWQRGVITFSDMLDQSGRALTLRELQDDQLVSWLPNSKYHDIQKSVEKLPYFAEIQEKYGLTEEEGVALYAYTTNLYKNINPKMREGNLTKKDLGFISVVEQGLSKLPIFEGKVYRYVDIDAKYLRKYQMGEIVTEAAFTSSSVKEKVKGFDGYVKFVILSKNGKRIYNLSKYPHQYEILFGENTKFKVISIGYDHKSNKREIQLEEIVE